MKKTLIRIGIVVLALAIFAGSVNAEDDDGDKISFGIRPTKADEDRPETFSYFSYVLAPGVVLDDEALVMNSGDVPITLTLYAADGFTAHNGGTAFTKQGQESNGGSRGVNGWLSLPVTEIALEPGEELVVPFTINVPPDASPGHHIAGLVVEALPSEGGEGQFVVNVIQQAGVAVVIDVPGAHVAGLEISGASLNQQDDQGATFVISVHNTGNIFIKAEGFLRVTDINFQELASIPIKMDTVLPGDATIFYVVHPVHFSDSDYLINVELNYEGKTAFLEGAEMKVRDGQPEVEGELGESVLPSVITDIFSPKPADDWVADIKAFILEYAKPSLVFLSLTGILIILVLAFLIWRRNQ